jgi:co-chaperonin GroES (HSP10)
MPAALMLHDNDPRKELLDKLGDISDFELFHNKVLVAIYVRPEKTKGGIILADTIRDEDIYQGKVGVIVKAGPSAFQSDGKWTWPESVSIGSWVVYRVSDGWSLKVNGINCRILDDVSIQAEVSSPDTIF